MHIENLENRQLFAFEPITIDGDTVVITGTNNKDTLTLNVVEDRFNLFINSTGQQAFIAGKTNILIKTKEGNDKITIDFEGDDRIEVPIRIQAGPGNDSIISGIKNDRIFCGTGDDTVYGGAGRDTIVGEGGDDVIFGGTGNDIMRGNTGNDTFDSDPLQADGNDKMLGQGGRDELHAYDEDDTTKGGTGKDEVIEEF